MSCRLLFHELQNQCRYDVISSILHEHEGLALQVRDEMNNTVLHAVVQNPSCSVPVVQLLLRRGANISAENIKSFTPLYVAIMNECCDVLVVKFLLDQGALFSRPACAISCVLYQYIANGPCKFEVIKELVSRENDENINGISYPENWSWNSFILPRLMRKKDSYDIVFYLLSSKWRFDVNSRDVITGWAPLHEAMKCKPVNERMVNLLLRHGADINIKSFNYGIKGQTPLHVALRTMYSSLCNCKVAINTLQQLLDAGASVAVIDDLLRSPLFLATQCYVEYPSYYGVLKLLLKYTIKYMFKISKEWQRNDFQEYLISSLCNFEYYVYVLRGFYDFIKDCQQELVQMKNSVLHQNLNLCDLIINCNLSINESIVHKVLEMYVYKDFPLYRSCIAKCIPRSELYKAIRNFPVYVELESAGKVSDTIILDSISVDNILKYLKNEDLFNFCVAYYSPSDNEQRPFKRQKLQ